jgi:protein involved in polysaccharide export with SLBB domain
MRGIFSVIFLALLAGIPLACKGAPKNDLVEPEIQAQVPVQAPTTAPPEPSRYLIQPGDELEIRFFHTPEQNTILPVRPDGFISIPLAYEIQAAGRTAEELRAELVERYSKELLDPEVAVIVRTFTAYQVHVGGEVKDPGVFELRGKRTVLQAIFEAGGMLMTAQPANVLLVRRMADGRATSTWLDLDGVLDEGDPSGDVLLQPYDIVYVPRSGIANLNKWIALYIRENIPITFSYRIGAD